MPPRAVPRRAAQPKYEREFAERCFRQIEGFGQYGVPESHAASFAILVYASSWVKWYHPEVFAAALLNSQPTGFYAPAQLVRDAAEYGVEVWPPDVNASDWDCTLEKTSGYRYALRLGFCQVTASAKPISSTWEGLIAGDRQEG